MSEYFFTVEALVFETQRWEGVLGFHEWWAALQNEENS